jgi:hypothetical protein
MHSPHSLADLYDPHLASAWRGDEPPSPIGDWLDARWTAGGPSEPESPPEAVSVLGGSGSGIRWYTVGESILGFVTGRPRGCYMVARDERPPHLPTPSFIEVGRPVSVPESMQ